jgi:hypothetical protein
MPQQQRQRQQQQHHVQFHPKLIYIEADENRTYEDIVLYNNYYYFKKIDQLRMHRLLSPLFTEQHRTKILTYIHTSCNSSAKSETATSLSPLFTEQHRTKILTYIHTSCNSSAKSETATPSSLTA